MSVTVAGLLQEQLQRLPDVGDEVVWSGFHFRVVEAGESGALEGRARSPRPREGRCHDRRHRCCFSSRWR